MKRTFSRNKKPISVYLQLIKVDCSFKALLLTTHLVNLFTQLDAPFATTLVITKAVCIIIAGDNRVEDAHPGPWICLRTLPSLQRWWCLFFFFVNCAYFISADVRFWCITANAGVARVYEVHLAFRTVTYSKNEWVYFRLTLLICYNLRGRWDNEGGSR